MADPLNIAISSGAFVISAVTAWFTLFRRGGVRMTQPTVIFFGLDGGRPPTRGPKAKVFLRTLLYSPAKRGSLVESMYVTLVNSVGSQNFNVWVYGDGKPLLRGSGLFVPETGIATNHHFLLPEAVERFDFVAGTYRLQVFVRVVGEAKPRLLFSQVLEVTPDVAEGFANYAGVYFDWAADSSTYVSHLEHPVIATSAGPLPMFDDFLAIAADAEARWSDGRNAPLSGGHTHSPRV